MADSIKFTMGGRPAQSYHGALAEAERKSKQSNERLLGALKLQQFAIAKQLAAIPTNPLTAEGGTAMTALEAAAASYLIRWKGKEEGPFPVDVIRGKFMTDQISLLHEVLKNGQWMTLMDFFTEPPQQPKEPNAILPANTPLPVHARRERRPQFADLSEATIRKATKSGETPLHRAAKMGKINEIPKHLLAVELFMARDSGVTPIHVAAKYGHLDQVPRQFLTKETMTMTIGDGFYLTGSGYRANTETPLHLAAGRGHAEQIPKEFFTPEFLSIEASGYRLTVLHQLAYANRLDLVPDMYASSEMWNLRNSSGQTARDVVEANKERAGYVARVRSEPPTDKQKEKLRWFGCALAEGMTKGEASDALDKCVRDFPEKNLAYYNRPATEEQLAKLQSFNESPDADPDEPYYDPGKPLTYGEAKDAISYWEMDQRRLDREREAAYLDSEECKFDDMMIRVNRYGDHARDVTIEEGARAWALVKSGKPAGAALPTQIEVENALENLYPGLINPPMRPGVLWHNYCRHCRGQIEVMIPPNSSLMANAKLALEDTVSIPVECPHCHRETGTCVLNTFISSCPHCSKQWSLLRSQAGTNLKCGNCQQDFLATIPI